MNLLRLSLLSSLTLAATACVAFFPPDEEDDGVTRCETSNDCNGPEYDDTRIEGQCVEAADDNAPKVCVAEWTRVNCNPELGQLKQYYDALVMDPAYMAGANCDEANRGKPGCLPGMNGCDEGTPITEEGPSQGLCPHPRPDEFSVIPPASEGELAGQDLADQACRALFCDEKFVCNRTSQQCVQCDPTKAPGDGGCAEVFINGERSPGLTPMGGLSNLPGAACGERAFASPDHLMGFPQPG